MTKQQRTHAAIEIIREHFGLSDTVIKTHQAWNGSTYLYWADEGGDHHWSVDDILWRSQHVW